MQPYYLHQEHTTTAIRSATSPLVITIHNLEIKTFTAGLDTVVFYGSEPGRFLALEAPYIPDQMHEVTAALTWYAAQFDYPIEMLTVRDPRSPTPATHLRIVR